MLLRSVGVSQLVERMTTLPPVSAGYRRRFGPTWAASTLVMVMYSLLYSTSLNHTPSLSSVLLGCSTVNFSE